MYIYTVIAVIGANIQVLKIVDFPFFSNPIALVQSYLLQHF